MSSVNATPPAKPPLYAILWDADGVLVDSEPRHRQKLHQLLRLYGIDIAAHDFSRPQSFYLPPSTPGHDWQPVIMPLHGAGDRQIYYWLLTQLCPSKDAAQLAAMDARLGGVEMFLTAGLEIYQQLPGMVAPRDTIDQLVAKLAQFSANQLVQAIVTSGEARQLDFNLRHYHQGGADPFIVKITAQPGLAAKPAPDCYGLALSQLQARYPAHQIVPIAIEDSGNGVLAAARAGIPVIQWLLPGAAPQAEAHWTVTQAAEIDRLLMDYIGMTPPMIAAAKNGGIKIPPP